MTRCCDIARKRDRVFVVAARPDDALYALLSPILAEEENRRSRCFRRPDDRSSYVAAHALKRLLLQCATHMPVAEQRFRFSPYGKPFLIGSDISFSISHTRGLAVVAIAWRCAVGVDVERITLAFDSDVDWRGLRLLSAAELDLIDRSENPHFSFLRLWTAKEAVSKAIGSGLAMPMEDIVIGSASASLGNNSWYLYFEYSSQTHIIAVATAGAPVEMEFLCLDEGNITRYFPEL